jgi:hypothetical protein
LVDQPDTTETPEFPAIDPDKMASPHAQEVEFALILSRMINSVKEDPAQMRLAIYEFARARLKIDTSDAEKAERNRLAAALETAIVGVEQFSARREEKDRLAPPAHAQIGPGGAATATPSTSMVRVYQTESAPTGALVPDGAYPRAYAEQVAAVRTRRASFWIGVFLCGVAAGLLGYHQRTSLMRLAGVTILPPAAETGATPSTQHTPEPGSPAGDPAAVRTASVSPGAPPFPLPSDYGVYALNNNALSELSMLQERVPDKRVAMSTPISQPSRTTLADGKARFVLFRRDLAGNAPERIDVRVVARVMRALTFDARGKPSFTPVSDAWNIRNISYEFRVRPLPGNPEMLLVQPAAADFVLPAGRYVLALSDQAYDFTVPGEVTDPAQCLERTDAANGEFYSACQKP